MEVILKKRLEGLGHQDDLVKVKPGYARNYLIPQGLAMVANKANRKVTTENARQAACKAIKKEQEAVALVKRLEQLTLTVKAKAGENDRIFGSVTPLQLSKVLKAQGILVEHTAIHLAHPVKTLGAHKAHLTLHQKVSYTLPFSVIQE